MKNIVTVTDLDNFLFNKIWKTENFKKLHQENLFFKALINKLNESPVYFFELSHEKGRNHLTSIFRFIPFREYSNPYINDLYYLHELCHCANYELNESIEDNVSLDYQVWSKKLSRNELFASLVSEVFIYFMDPTLINKTFNPLWAERFVLPIIKDKNYNTDNFIPYHTNIDKDWINVIESIDNQNFNLLSLEKNNWPQYINEVIKKREQLRTLTYDDLTNLDESEKIIVNYNLSHQKWLQLWTEHYLNIDSSLLKLKNKKLTPENFKQYMLDNCDEFGRPFFPKKTHILNSAKVNN